MYFKPGFDQKQGETVVCYSGDSDDDFIPKQGDENSSNDDIILCKVSIFMSFTYVHIQVIVSICTCVYNVNKNVYTFI